MLDFFPSIDYCEELDLLSINGEWASYINTILYKRDGNWRWTRKPRNCEN